LFSHLPVSIVISTYLFQALLKQSDVTGLKSTDIGGGGHPSEAIDSEIARIVDEALMGPEGPTSTEGVLVI
jgi:hypothetical protein